MTSSLKFCGKTYVEEIDKAVLIAFRDYLNTLGNDGKPYEPDTVYNKLMDVITFLKHNGLMPHKLLLEKKEASPGLANDEAFSNSLKRSRFRCM